MMADVEKVKRVKKGLACCSTDAYKCDDCPYIQRQMFSNNCTGYMKICADAMSVIDELQAEIERLQPKKGKWIFKGQTNAYGGTVIQCPFCDDKYAAHNPSDEHFCRNCGAKLTD